MINNKVLSNHNDVFLPVVKNIFLDFFFIILLILGTIVLNGFLEFRGYDKSFTEFDLWFKTTKTIQRQFEIVRVNVIEKGTKSLRETFHDKPGGTKKVLVFWTTMDPQKSRLQIKWTILGGILRRSIFCLNTGWRTLSYVEVKSRKTPTRYSHLVKAIWISDESILMLSKVFKPFQTPN